VAELADALGSGLSGANHRGSTPLLGISKKINLKPEVNIKYEIFEFFSVQWFVGWLIVGRVLK
jgi:hypothetical protein